MLNIILNKGEENNVLVGFPWVYNNEIYTFDGEIVNGDVVKVLTFGGAYV